MPEYEFVAADPLARAGLDGLLHRLDANRDAVNLSNLEGAMPSIYGLKPKFQALLRPAVRQLAAAGITANQVTIGALLLSLGAGAAIALANGGKTLLLLPGVLLARMALNAMDGMLAREHNQKSPLGAMLNELGDVIADAGMYLPLALVPGFNPLLLTCVVLLSLLAEMTGVIGVQIGASRRYDGPLGKSDRAFVFGFLGLLLGLGVKLEPVIPYVLGVMVLLLVLTIWNRARQALREVRAVSSVK
jgi:CDP-diacylglycerol--glycerol-3-phosphate 3-phosphatidyltransferase